MEAGREFCLRDGLSLFAVRLQHQGTFPHDQLSWVDGHTELECMGSGGCVL